MIYLSGDRPSLAHFPDSGIISLVVNTKAGGSCESGVVGIDGALALVEVMGGMPIFPEASVQAEGWAWTTPASLCREIFACDPSRRLLTRHAQNALVVARQSIACQAHHRLDARLARWILECRDRLGEGDLPLTQEFMSAMLGVQRTTVSTTAAGLEARGLIETTRGRVRVLDEARLEAAACECRDIIKHFTAPLIL